MNYGFVIDTRSCIGCHACTTACKSENQVPLGVNRTWVKYTESGSFPDTRRSFQVTRCNHCANPPCVRICPVAAMYQRDDGIVEFNGDACIGCKGCLQACPYDAIYIDPDSGTAAKCHFCGHRVDAGLEPACVVVCPTQAIIAGDMDDPGSVIARTLAKNDVTVRKPEQGTAPKLFYIQGHAPSMHPDAAPREPDGLVWADVLDAHGRPGAAPYQEAKTYAVRLRFEGEELPPPRAPDAHRAPSPQGLPEGGPIQLAPAMGGNGRQAGHMVSYNVSHRVPWHWQVPAYLLTKAAAAGLAAGLAAASLGGLALPLPATLALGGLSLLLTLATTGLLVSDLERPERFLRILTRPQWRSWLTRGAFLLIAFSLVLPLWLLIAAVPALAALPAVLPAASLLLLALSLGTATYTAFLFAQCEGRDLWQSQLLPAQMAAQALTAGAACAAPVVWLLAPDAAAPVHTALAAGLLIHLAMLIGESSGSHASAQAALAARAITHGRYRRHFRFAVAAGHLLPLALLAAGGLGWIGAAPAAALAALPVLAGLAAYKHAFVAAPQELPNS